MKELCPAARACFSASLPNYQLVLSGWSRHGKGYRQYKACRTEKVMGGVYDITGQRKRVSWIAFGVYPAICDKIKLLLFRDTGEAVEAYTYIQKNQAEIASPSTEYLKIIRKALYGLGSGISLA